MSAKTSAVLYLQPKNSRPLKNTAQLDYRNTAELKKQIKAHAATVWISAKRIDVDTHSQEILIDGTPAANYRLHFPHNPTAAEPVFPGRPARRISTRARHTTAQLAVVALGLLLEITAGPALNGAWILGVLIAGFGIYRLAHTAGETAQRSPAAGQADAETVTVDELLRGAA